MDRHESKSKSLSTTHNVDSLPSHTKCYWSPSSSFKDETCGHNFSIVRSLYTLRSKNASHLALWAASQPLLEMRAKRWVNTPSDLLPNQNQLLAANTNELN